ncbi:CARDB domain-containing protein [uncultured Methanobrevibacter sp.]|uniref:CARDB domain-containing protein n=1 Tax=uncultured Methanobrevibacter sp. TaxID=253161 RepID=UPI0025E774F4|nr:CARDB domain-containing protein [uncultured Methanobrevibacter sp.]
MKGKRLIVIMAIVILIFTIQASCALENDNNFNLTQATDVKNINVQTDDVKEEITLAKDNISNVASVSSQKEVLSASNDNNNPQDSNYTEILGVSNDNDVLGRYIHVTAPTLSSLRLAISSANPGDWIFLDGLTFTGEVEQITIDKRLIICGGSSPDDNTRATLDLSQVLVSGKNKFQISKNTVDFRGIDFVNFYYPPSGSTIGRAHLMSVTSSVTMTNCNFINNTVFQKSYIIEFTTNAFGSTRIDNCQFINNTASVIVSAGNSRMTFTANNNRFINNSGTMNNENETNSLGLCIKAQIAGSTFDNNIFINNTNAVHGAAYCVNARNVVITNNHIENNKASYGAGIECHLGYVTVINTTFINNEASGYHIRDPQRSGTGGAIAFVGPRNYLENCTFINNTAENYGGAMDIHFGNGQEAHYTTVVNSKFENNVAQNQFAGAIYIQGNYATIDRCNFTNNSAPTGGAIQLMGMGANIIDSNFYQNDAIVGGACYVEGNRATVSNSKFENNTATHDLGSLIKDDASKITSGGAMYVKSNDVSIIDSSFNDNIAYGNFSDNTGLGGALYILGQNPSFHNDNFTSNDAIRGGAVYIEGSNIGASKINLYNNTAIEGGAVYINGNNIDLDYFNVTGNNAIQGGAIYIEGERTDITNSIFEDNHGTRNIDLIKSGAESLPTMGGAIYIEGNYVDIYDNNTFRRNVAFGAYNNGGLGGAIAVNGNNTNIYDDNFTMNEAVKGGAIYIRGTNATVKDMYFTTNNAIQGGAVFIEGTNANITNNTFYDNNATHNLTFTLTDELLKLSTKGGAISVSGDYANIVNNNFTYNAAIGRNPTGGLGGAIAIDGYHTTIYDNMFDDNEAIIGGALYITGTNTTIDLVNFTNNNAIQGGAVYVKGLNTNIVRSEFKCNNATHNLTYSLTPELFSLPTIGGAISIEGNNTLLKDINFNNNTAIGIHLDGGYGGAAALNGYDTEIINVTFDANQAIRGGAVYVNGTVNTLNDTVFTNNAAIRGGAVYNSASHTTILNSKYVNNTATQNLRFNVNDVLYSLTTMGGAVAIRGYSVNATTCEFINNTAIGIFENGGLGGAIAVNGSDNYIFNSTFKFNEAVKGGAFYLLGNSTTILNSSFYENNAIKGGAGYIDGENSHIENSIFDDNDARHDLRFTLSDVLKDTDTAGGAIYIIGNNVNVTSSNFTDNDAKAFNENVTRGGGAFYIEGNNANISSSYFENNTALKGGAVFITGNHTQFYDSNFTKNSVTNFTVMEGFGGAIYLENSHNSDITRCIFDQNTASINGGAIDWHEGATDGQIVDCIFTNNTAGANAGAVFWFGVGGIIKGSNFTENKANGTVKCVMGNFGDGGAIMWTGSNGTVDDCNFINNTANQRGGAVFLRSVEGRAPCDNNTFKNSHFEDNTAGTNGGAIDWYQGATNGAIENSTFEHNVANRSAGAVFWNGNTGKIVSSNFTNNYVTGTNVNPDNNNTGNGGAIMWLGSNGLVDDCIFVNNTAPRLGGAVYLEASSFGSAENTTFSNSYFENNAAGINGGAINWHEGAKNGKIVDSTFVNNTAKANGGAVFWFGDNGNITGSDFTDNKALGLVNGTYLDSGCGGAVIWTGSNGTVDNCKFINNSAAKNGGAVYLRNLTENGCDNTTFSNSHFENNTAGRNGGAIDWHNGATNGRIENSTLVNNTARANGGAVYWYGNNGNIIGSNFTNNKALGEVNGTFNINTGCGGALIWTGSNGTVDNCNFINNSAAQNGGAVFLRGVLSDICDNTTFSNSHFENNTAGINGGAIDWHEGATNGRIDNSTFVNNTARANGGAVFWYGNNGTIAGSNFTDNKALGTAKGTYGRSGDGGAVIWTGSNGLVDDCNFANNNATNRGGAVFLDAINKGEGDNTTFSNSHFENNVAGTNGGAIDWYEGATNGKIVNSTFENNTAHRAGGAVYWNGLNGTIVGSNFTNNKATGLNKTAAGKGGAGGAVIWIGSNGLVDDCIFENNTAAENGGAVFLQEYNNQCDNTTFKNSKFINNTAAKNGGAIDWNEGATNGSIINSTFDKNNATNGGAVSWSGHNGRIIDSNFTDNYASENGGAVLWSGINGEIDNSRFVNNTAKNGGAIYLQNCEHGDKTNVTIKDSYFENNSAVDGGAINWYKGTNATIDNTEFVDNFANRGGAVFVNGTDGTIKNSNFTANEAILGGAVYANNEKLTISDSNFDENAAIQGGAAFIDAAKNFIKYSNFTMNNATYTLRKVNTTGNNNKTKGGAVYINGTGTVVDNSKFLNNTAVTEREYNNETNNPLSSDDGFGGAIYVGADNAQITSSEFNDNKACNGSALYNDATGTQLDGDKFIKNQAWSYNLDVNATPNSTFYGSNITIEIANYTGGDNIINGIYNAKSVNSITFNNVNYVINDDESSIGITGETHPVSGVENSNNGKELYQDSLERYQNIVLEFINNETGKVVRTVTIKTDAYGNYTLNVTGFAPGNYTVKAYHPEDRNYKYIGDVTTFEILPYVDINITKTVESYYTIVGNNVKFTVTVSNAGNASNASNIKVKDIIPAAANLELVESTVTDGTFSQADWSWTIDKLANGTSETLTLVFKTTTLGKFNNTVNVTCAEDEWNYTNNNASVLFEVVMLNLTINKTANVESIYVMENVTFTINVTNNAKVNATNVVVTDIVPKGFEYVKSNVTGYNSKTGLLIIDVLKPGESYLFTITLKAVTNGTLTNYVNVTCKENSTFKKANASVYVIPVVNLTVVKNTDFDDYIVGDTVVFTITVTNNGPSNATNIQIKDIFDSEGLELLDGDLEQTIAFLENGTSKSVTIKANVTKLGDWINKVNVTCDQNDTIKSANVTVHVYNVDLRINKTANATYVPVNGLINFTITVKNHSDRDAHNVIITDTLNSVFELIPGNYNVTGLIEGNLVVETVATLKAGESYSIWFVVRAKTNGTYVNTAGVICNEEKTLQRNSETVVVYPVVDLKVNKTSNVKVGENVTVSNDVVFTINVTNDGISSATGVKITDVVPEGFEFVSSSADDYDNETGLLTVALIKPGESYVFTITLKVIANGTLTNTVNVTCNENKTLISNSSSINAIPVILTVNKTANVTLVGNNTLVNFTITVNNTGIANATNINVTDVLPKGFVFVSASAGYTNKTQTVSWIIDKLNGGNVTKLWIVAKSTAVGNWSNVVNVTCKENKTVVSDKFNVTIGYTNITVNKTANVTVVGNNTLVKFTIIVNNTGIVNATGVTVKDVLPNGFVFVSASAGNIPVGQKVSWTIDMLEIGKPVEFVIVARSNATGNWTNVVDVNSTENATVVDSSVTVDVRPVSLTVNKTANVTVVGNNTLVKFTIVVNNTGVMNATNVSINDVLPVGFVFVSASAGNTTVGQKVSWTIDKLNIGDVKEFVIVARSNATGNWTNVVDVNSTENATVVDSSVTVDVRPVSLTVNKTANVTVVGNNTLVKFTIVVNNTGVMNATNVSINDVLPVGFVFVSASAGNTTVGQKVSWTIDKFDTGDVETFWIIARTIATNTTTNVVTVTSAENKTNVTGKAVVDIVEINATLNKTANITVIGNNTLVNFTIVLNHTSIINATNVTICDVLPNGFVFVDAMGDYTQTGKVIKWHFDTVKSGQVIRLWITARSNSTGKWNNTVSVSSDENISIATTNATVNVVSVNATVNKTANVTVIGNNTLVKFTISVNYTSIVNATNVTIKDVLPSGFTFVGASDGHTQVGQKVEWYFDTLTKGFYELWIVARSNAVGKWNNTVVASCNENSTFIGDNATVDVCPVNATINKTANVTLIGNNTLVKFTISVNYTSVVNATNVTIRDVLPNGFTFVSATGDYDRNGQEIKWHFDNLTKGYFEFEIIAKSNATGNWKNTVTASCNENSTIICDNVTVEVAPVNITVIKDVDVKSVDVLGLVNFTITVTNNGKINVTNVSFTDIMDLSVFEIKGHNGTFKQNGNELLFEIGSLNVGDTYKVWIQAKALTNGTFTNVVNVTSFENKTAGYDNVSVKVIPIVNLTVVKTVNVEKIGLNNYVVFTINVTNNGPSNATNVEINDALPIGLEYYDSNLTGYVYGEEYIVPLILPGKSFAFTITAWAIEEGNFTNKVYVTCAENGTVKKANASVEVVVVNLTAVKYPDNAVVGNNSLVNFTIEVKNNDVLNATYVFVYDIIPDGFEFVNATEGYYHVENLVFWVIEKLVNGSTDKLWIVLKTTKVDNLTNEVEIFYTENSYKVYTNSTLEVVPVNLTINKTAGVDEIYLNDEITFTINVTNNAVVNATNVNVIDVVPYGFEFVKSNATGYDNKTGLLTIPVIEAGKSYLFTITLKAITNGTLTNYVNVTSSENNTVVNTTAKVNVIPVVNLTVVKTVDVAEVYVNDEVTFTVNVTNNGPSNATGVKITDVVPGGFEFVRASDSGYDNVTGLLTVPVIEAGESFVFTITLKAITNGTLTNVVNVTSKENSTVKCNSSSVKVIPVVNLTVEKVADMYDALVGDEITFIITVTNNGPSNATNIKVIDILDEDGFTLVSGDLESVIPFLESGKYVSIVIKVNTTSKGSFMNTVNVTCDQNDTIKSANATVNVYMTDMKINKSADVNVTEVNGLVNFTIVVKNHGTTAATNVHIIDDLGSGFEFVNASAGYTRNGQTVVWNAPSVASEGSYSVWIVARALTNGTLSNIAHVNCSEESTVKNSTSTVDVTPVVNLTVVKTVDVAEVYVNDEVTFTVNVTNNGPSNATGVKITDVVPGGFEFVRASDSGYDNVTGLLTVPVIEAGESFVFTITLKAVTNGTLSNVVNVTSAENDTVVNSSISVKVAPVVNLTVVKTVDVAEVYVNDEVTFTVNVTNNGPSNATGVKITDVVPGGFEFVRASDSGYDNVTGLLTVPVIEAGESFVFTITLKAVTNGTLSNVVNVTSAENDTVVNSSISVKVAPVVNLTVVKTVDVAEVYVNDEVTFTVNVTNNGPSNATGVKITDVVPGGFEFVRASDSGYDNVTGLLTVPVIEAGESFVFTITLKAVTNGTLSNVVNVTSAENDTVVNSSISVKVAPVVNLTVVKVADMDDATIGDVITFTITVTNNGPSDATNIRVIDILDKGLTLISGDLETVIPFLASGNSTAVVVKVRTTAKGDYMNCVNVSCDENDTIKSANASVHVYNTDMKIIKTANVTSVDVNGLVNFTIIVKNHGRFNATNIHVTDELSGAFEFVNASAGYTRNGQTVVWNAPSVASEGSYSVWIVARALTNGTLSNIAHVNCSEESTVKNSTSTVDVTPVVNLTVVKTVDVAEVYVNDEVTFTVNVTNNGPSNATGVKITDVVPGGFEFVRASDSGYDNVTGLLTVPVIEAGESFVFTITLKAITNGTLSNVVNVTSAENDTAVTSTISVNVTPVVNLTVEKVASTDDALVGDEITFTITVTNNGPSNATNVKVIDILDKEGFDLISGDLETVIPVLESGKSATIVVKVKTIAKGSFMNAVNVTCDQNDTVKSANATVNVYMTDMKIIKTANVTSVDVNGLVNFTIVVKNHGTTAATNVHIIDDLGSGFEFVNASAGYTRNGQTVVWNAPSVASEGSYSVWIVARALTNGTLSNIAHVNCSEESTVKNSTSTVDVTPVVNLTVEKTANVENITIGSEVTFTINVTNHGPSKATNVVVEDILPNGFELISGDVKTIIDVLQNGESKIITIKVKATSTGNLTNVVSVYSNENTTMVKSNVTVRVNNPKLSTSQTPGDEFVYSGNQTTFTIKVTNEGDVPLTGIFINDKIPEGLVYDHFIGPNWTYDGNRFHYSGSLDVGETVELTIVVNATESGKFTNIASVGSDQTGTSTSNASVIVYTPALKVREISNNPTALVGQSVSFTVVVTNIGDCELTGIYTVNNFPDGLVYTGYTGDSWDKLTSGLLGAPVGGWIQDGNKFVYLGTLKPGESANYTLYFDTTRVGVFTPEVLASSDLTSNDYSNNTTVVVEPKLEVKQVIDKSYIHVGEKVTVTITVTNAGGCVLGDVYVIEKVPEGLKFNSYSGNGWTKSGDKFTYSGELGIGESASFTITFDSIKEGNVINTIVAGSNMTEEIDNHVDVEIVNKTKPAPKPTPKPKPKPEPKPVPKPVHPVNNTTGKHINAISEPVTMHATGNPIILLLLVLMAIIPLRRFKH